MSKHIGELLNAYLDGELHGARLQHVETHLAECRACQAELDSLKSLSFVLQKFPAPELTPAERFAAQVSLRLPVRQVRTSENRVLEISWWMVPVGLLAAWIFFNTSFFIGDVLSAVSTVGLLGSISDLPVIGPASGPYLSAALGQFGVLSGNTLDMAVSMESITRSSLSQISVQVSIAVLYLGWIAIWWARHTRRGHGQLIEG